MSNTAIDVDNQHPACDSSLSTFQVLGRAELHLKIDRTQTIVVASDEEFREACGPDSEVWYLANVVDESHSGHATNSDIIRRELFVVDVDPKRPSGTPATPKQRQDAHQVMANVIEFLTVVNGFPRPLARIDSGNGNQAIWRAEDMEQLVQNATKVLAAMYPEIDTSVSSRAQYIRAWPSTNQKCGRRTRLLELNLDADKLKAADLRELVDQRPAMDKTKHGQRARSVQRYLSECGDFSTTLEESPGIYKLQFYDQPCPLKDPASNAGYHKDGRNAAVLVFPEGSIGCHCFHEKCNPPGRDNWQFLQSKCSKPYVFWLADQGQSELAPETSQDWVRRMRDPRTHAEVFLEKHKCVTIDGDVHRWSPERHWRRTTRKGLLPTIARVVSAWHVEQGYEEYFKEAHSNEAFAAIQTATVVDMEGIEYDPTWLVDRLDDPAHILVVNNGQVNVLTGEFRPPNAELYYHAAAPFDFDPDAQCPRFLEFLNVAAQGEQDWVDQLQAMCGALLVPEICQQHIALLMGETRAGKGLLLSLLHALLGGRVAGSTVTKSLLGEFGLEPLLGAKQIVLSEFKIPTGEGKQLCSLLKSISGWDPQSIARKYRKNVHRVIKAPIWIHGNDKNEIMQDNSGGLLARLIPLPFGVSFEGREDMELPSRLMAELPGILNWCLAGVQKLKEHKGKIPLSRAARDNLQTLERQTTPMRSFVRECVDMRDGSATTVERLHQIYSEWTDEPMAKSKFVKALLSSCSSLRSERTRSRLPADLFGDKGGRLSWVVGCQPNDSMLNREAVCNT